VNDTAWLAGMTQQQWRQAADDLDAARHEIEARGWCRGDLQSGTQVCLLGAVAYATHPEEAEVPFRGPQGHVLRRTHSVDLDRWLLDERAVVAETALERYLRQAYPSADIGPYRAVTHINDNELHDQAEAVELLEKAAVAAREQVGA
jgi:hypothetical protein